MNMAIWAWYMHRSCVDVLISLLVQDKGDVYSLHTTPDGDDATHSAAFTPVMLFTSVAGSSKVKSEATSKTPSRASTPKSRTMSKQTLQDAFAEGSAKDNLVLERLGAQKHEHAIGELELKHRKLENKAMEKQHQREQHEFCMMQMRMMISQNRQTAPMTMPSQNQPSFEGFSLMGELNGASLPSESPSLSPYPI
jgi:hypothetical protein